MSVTETIKNDKILGEGKKYNSILSSEMLNIRSNNQAINAKNDTINLIRIYYALLL